VLHESDVITPADVYIAKPPAEDEAAEPGKPVNLLNPLTCTGLKPQFLEKMAANGVTLPPSFFGDNTAYRPNYAAANYGGFE
jgi:hypothetical protein